jgi:hypothetical protein
MSHFALINENNVVINVVVVADSQEHRGQEYLAVDCGLGGRWIQTSYNHKIRKQYAGVGYTYDEINDVFVSVQPFPSWSLDENHDWQPPVARPEGGGSYLWDEDAQNWIED